MNHTESMHAAFTEVMKAFNSSFAIKFLESGKFSITHYKSVLREIYHYTKENPQLQTLAAVRFRGSDRHLVKMFLRHAVSEVGHDLAALADLEALGERSQQVNIENPLPATIALTAYPFYEIGYRNPIAYLGYLFFLEHMPTEHGATYARALQGAGVPDTAMGFLKEHMHADVGHNKLMKQYLDQLLHDQRDADAAIYAMQVTSQLYANMLRACIERADVPVNYGTCWVEVARLKVANLPLGDDQDEPHGQAP